MLARAVLTVIAHPATRPPQPADEHLIPLTLNEIRRLFAKLIIDTVHTVAHQLAWSPTATPTKHKPRPVTTNFAEMSVGHQAFRLRRWRPNPWPL